MAIRWVSSGKVDLPDEVCEEHRAAFEHRDQDGLPPHVVPGDRAAELLHPAADVLAAEQHASELRHRLGSLAAARPPEGTRPERSRRLSEERVDDRRDGARHGARGSAPPGARGRLGRRRGRQRRAGPSRAVAPEEVNRSEPTTEPLGGGYAAPGDDLRIRSTGSRPSTETSASRPAPATTGTSPPRIAYAPQRLPLPDEARRSYAANPWLRSAAASEKTSSRPPSRTTASSRSPRRAVAIRQKPELAVDPVLTPEAPA